MVSIQDLAQQAIDVAGQTKLRMEAPQKGSSSYLGKLFHGKTSFITSDTPIAPNWFTMESAQATMPNVRSLAFGSYEPGKEDDVEDGAKAAMMSRISLVAMIGMIVTGNAPADPEEFANLLLTTWMRYGKADGHRLFTEESLKFMYKQVDGFDHGKTERPKQVGKAADWQNQANAIGDGAVGDIAFVKKVLEHYLKASTHQQAVEVFAMLSSSTWWADAVVTFTAFSFFLRSLNKMYQTMVAQYNGAAGDRIHAWLKLTRIPLSATSMQSGLTMFNDTLKPYVANFIIAVAKMFSVSNQSDNISRRLFALHLEFSGMQLMVSMKNILNSPLDYNIILKESGVPDPVVVQQLCTFMLIVTRNPANWGETQGGAPENIYSCGNPKMTDFDMAMARFVRFVWTYYFVWTGFYQNKKLGSYFIGVRTFLDGLTSVPANLDIFEFKIGYSIARALSDNQQVSSNWDPSSLRGQIVSQMSSAALKQSMQIQPPTFHQPKVTFAATPPKKSSRTKSRALTNANAVPVSHVPYIKNVVPVGAAASTINPFYAQQYVTEPASAMYSSMRNNYDPTTPAFTTPPANFPDPAGYAPSSGSSSGQLSDDEGNPSGLNAPTLQQLRTNEVQQQQAEEWNQVVSLSSDEESVNQHDLPLGQKQGTQPYSDSEDEVPISVTKKPKKPSKPPAENTFASSNVGLE